MSKHTGSIIEKCRRLGFKDAPGDIHFSQLLDLCLDFQEWTKGAGAGEPTGDELNICSMIHWRLTHGGEEIP